MDAPPCFVMSLVVDIAPHPCERERDGPYMPWTGEGAGEKELT